MTRYITTKYFKGILAGSVVTKGTDGSYTYKGENVYIDEALLDPYIETLPTKVFKNSIFTPDPYDVPQNLLWDGRTMVNQCGELSVAYCLNVDVAYVLQNWQRKNSWWYSYTFQKYKDRGTSADALLDILDALGETGQSYYEVMKTETPYRVSQMLLKHQIVTSVNINATTGKLSQKGVLHWIVLERVEPERDGGVVYFANSYNDRIERCSWEEYVAASGSVQYGVAVKRVKEFGFGLTNILDDLSEISAERDALLLDNYFLRTRINNALEVLKG